MSAPIKKGVTGMKTYTIFADIDEYDDETRENADPMGMPEIIGIFPTLLEAQRYLVALPKFEPRGSVILEDWERDGVAHDD